jgi:hypothetical protein
MIPLRGESQNSTDPQSVPQSAAETFAHIRGVPEVPASLPFGWAGDDEAGGLGDAEDPVPGGILSSARPSGTAS